MPLLQNLLTTFLDTLTGHLALAIYLLAVTDERVMARRLKKLPLLLLSPFLATLLSAALGAVPKLMMFHYFIISFAVLFMCSLWVRHTWGFGFWRAFAATCMAAVFQVAAATVSWMAYWAISPDNASRFAVAAGLHLGCSIMGSLLLYKLRFGAWFRLLLNSQTPVWRTALLLFGLEAAMEVFLQLLNGVQAQFLAFYYLLVAVMAVLMAAVVIYRARQLDAARIIQAQQDTIARQQLYEQDLEDLRREMRAFCHDYKNLLAGLSQQAVTGDLEDLHHTLSQLDNGFDLGLGAKLQSLTPMGNLQIPQVRSLLLSKLTVMEKKAVECRLEALYPVDNVAMDIWDYVRCLGILTDNAVEAALDTQRPWVEILFLSHDGQVSFRVSNPYKTVIEPGNMWNHGWSTKGPGRGLGLASYQRILERYPNASSCTSWDKGVFIQELTVEDRR